MTEQGTTRWMAPELLDPESFGSVTGYTSKEADSYAFGMLIYEVR